MNCHTASEKLILGRQTEHGVETIKFPIADWISNYGSGGTFHLWHKRSTDTNAYPVVITSDEQYVYWTPTATDLAYNGFGEAQLGYSFGTVGQTGYRKAMSQIWTTRVDRSVEAGSSAPTPYVPWVTQVEGYADRAEDAAEEAEASAEEAAAIAASIHGIPSGGTTGQVMKKNSNTDYDISWQDESGGGSSDFDDLTNRPSYNGTAMTHVTNIPEVKTDTWDGKYSKPASGVPKTDLASDVQTSLNKADSALQSVPPTYRTAALQDIIDNELDSRLDAAELDINNLESDKVDKVTGKGLSTNDYTDADKTKVANAITEHQSLAAYRTASAQDTIDAGKVPTSRKVNGHALTSDVTIADTDIAHGSSTVGASLDTAFTEIANIEGKIPTEASSSNQLADKAYVDSGLSGKMSVPSGGSVDDVLTKTANGEVWSSRSKWTLIWTNPNPSSALAAQVIDVNIEEYDFLALEGRLWAPIGWLGFSTVILKVGTGAQMVSLSGTESFDTGQAKVNNRVVQANAGTQWRIVVGDNKTAVSTGEYTVDNDFNAITHIYGIKI